MSEGWAKFVREQKSNWKDAFIYFKHEESGIGPKLAKQMLELLAREAASLYAVKHEECGVAAVLTLAASAAIMKPVYSVPQSGMLVSKHRSRGNSRRRPADASTMSSIAENLERVRGQIAQGAAKAGRASMMSSLSAISKTHDAAKVREAIEAEQACSAKVGSRKRE